MQFMERPLSTFVIVSFLLGVVQIYLCYTSLISDCTFATDASIGHSTWVMVELNFAVVNLAFALYFQDKVWNNILDRKNKFMSNVSQHAGSGMLGGSWGGAKYSRGQFLDTNAHSFGESPNEYFQVEIKPESVQASFREVFLRDVGVLAYFFGLIAIFVFSYIGKGNTEHIKGVCSNERFIYRLGFAFFWVAFTFAFMWYCCKCCTGTLTLEKEEKSDDVV